MAFKRLPSAAYLHECFSYNPDTGELRWRLTRPRRHFRTASGWKSWTGRCAGRVVRSVGKDGYITVSIDYQRYYIHRLIWKMQTGRQPPAEIDHRNTKRVDNRWSNLRKATHRQNVWNSLGPRAGSGLPKGVCAQNIRGIPSGRYCAWVGRHGKNIYLGTFNTPEEAEIAYRSFTDKFRGEFQHPAVMS